MWALILSMAPEYGGTCYLPLFHLLASHIPPCHSEYRLVSKYATGFSTATTPISNIVIQLVPAGIMLFGLLTVKVTIPFYQWQLNAEIDSRSHLVGWLRWTATMKLSLTLHIYVGGLQIISRSSTSWPKSKRLLKRSARLGRILAGRKHFSGKEISSDLWLHSSFSCCSNGLAKTLFREFVEHDFQYRPLINRFFQVLRASDLRLDRLHW